MSKVTFSQTACDLMYKKMKALEYNVPNLLFSKYSYFEVMLCLSYMTLSKEQIIEKDMKNHNRMDRLSQMVDTKEIDKVFTPGFAPSMPKIINARENNNLWILDNIRDSIMHGVFEIDEERECFIINNPEYDRELEAEIPFSWFIAYAKNDILSKKTIDNYMVRGFYYNKDKITRRSFNLKKELIYTIMYRVNITGSSFNVRDIENRINELFTVFSEEEVTEEEIAKYQNRILKERIDYNPKYLVSFYKARQKVKTLIESEFPGTKVTITVDNRKHRLLNQVTKTLPNTLNSYDLMYTTFNNMVSKNSTSLLRYLTNIIESLDTIDNIDYNKVTPEEIINIFNHVLHGKDVVYTTDYELKLIHKQNINILRNILLNVYGLTTLVINHEGLYSQHFTNTHPSNFGIKAFSKKPFYEYYQKRRRYSVEILKLEAKLFMKQEQLSKCKDEKAKVKIQNDITTLENEKQKYVQNLLSLHMTVGYEEIVQTQFIDHKEREDLENTINKYYENFNKAKTYEAKLKIIKVIGSLYDKQIEMMSKYTYGYCNDMVEVLTIIRNCFSHVGRIYIGKDRGEQTNVVLNDYDTDNTKSGTVICTYMGLINLLRNPYDFVEEPKLLEQI